jgi:hypothetical protein
MKHGKVFCSLFFALCCAGREVPAADLKLNGQRINAVQSTAAPNINCNRGEGSINCGHGGGSDPDKTPFLQELVRDADNRSFYHVIIGDPDSGGFVQEVYIQASGARWRGGIGSASGGSLFTADYQAPLAAGAVSGNGTGNPTRVIMQQVVQDGDMKQVFLKDQFLTKPKISNEISSGEMHMEFTADMRDLSLMDMDTAATVINRLAFTGLDEGAFDLGTNAPYSHVTAGQYLWVPGDGPDQSGGTWKYKEDDMIDPALYDWVFYRHPDENPPS